MSDSLFSPHWYRVAELTPRIRSHAQFRRHHYRGQLWYVLDDRASGRHHRFTPAAYHFIARFDGTQSVQDAWDATTSRLGDDAPTQDESIQLMGQLHAADVLQCDVPPDTEELFNRYQREQRQKWKKRLMNPLAVRIPLVDPDRFLETWLPFVRPFFGWFGFLIWAAIVVTGVVLATTHWKELSAHAASQALSPMNLVLLVIVYPIVKGVHELGHGFATKVWGGEVHEMGIMFLVFMPVPYVDATASASFPEKTKRISVSAAGMMVELGLAALCMFLWMQVEPGIVRDIALNVMLIGGISTLLFNGNPLLRFDGYYILADAIDIPNLATRSKQYLGYLFRRYLCGVRDAESPVVYKGERSWLFGYAIGSTLFRIAVMIGIIIFVAGEFFVIGVILAGWAATTQIIFPVIKSVAFLVENPQLQEHRVRAIGLTGAVLAGLAMLLFVAPFPLYTATEGVVWAPEKSEIRAETDAVIERIVAKPDSIAQSGEVLLEMFDPDLSAKVTVLEAELVAAQAAYQSFRTEKQLEADLVLEEITTIEADLALARERLGELTVRSPTDGFFLVDRSQDLVGRFVRHGDLIGFVADLSTGTVRVAVTQDNMGLIRNRTESVRIRLAEQLDQPLTAKISREMPLATHRIPSAVLGTMGGGLLAVDPSDQSGTTTLDQVFHIELTLDTPVDRLGGRTYVLFDHGSEPIGFQWYRRVRQLLLRQFNV